MGPRRILAVTAVLALAVLALTTGIAAAWNGANHPGVGNDRPATSEGQTGTGAGWQGRLDNQVDQGSKADRRARCNQGGPGEQRTQGDQGGVKSTGVGSGSASEDGPGNATASGAGTPPAPLGAPAAAASGPAPDAAASAPVTGGVTGVYLAAGATAVAPGGAAPASEVTPVATPAPSAATTLDGLGALSALPFGAVEQQVPDGPAAARALLVTGTGRSLGAIGVLLATIALFLALHRRADRGDRKLAATPSGPQVARFR